jgi:RND family efflux transporter MFP subunit
MDHNQNNVAQEFSSSKRWHWILQLLFSIALIAGGIFGARLLIKSKKAPVKMDQPKIAPLVEVEQLVKRDIIMTVRGYGTVKPKVQVEIVPQVSGNIVFVHAQFKPGGFIQAGKIILRIDPRDYELAVQQTKALVADALVKLDLQKAEAQVAKLEWQQLNLDKEPPSPLVFREPYVRQAEAALESARAQLAKAKLNLERTSVSLPIDVVIMSERVDLGQFVGGGQMAGVAYGTNLVEIEVPLEDDELAWFEIPGNPISPNGNGQFSGKSTAEVRSDFAGSEHVWTGNITRTTGQVDTTSGLVSVVVEVAEPFKKESSKPPLLPGMFVEVVIEGNKLHNAVAVTRNALHNGNEIWLVKDGRLEIVSLEIVRTDGQYAYVLSGIEDGDDIVISPLDVVISGMKVRTQNEPITNPEPSDANS